MYKRQDKEEYSKVLVFVSNKRRADLLFNSLEEVFGFDSCVIHSNKTQNYRIRSIRQFDEGSNRILVATDVMARGLDLDGITHVVNFDTPYFPENYMHRIGRTGRAEREGKTILFSTEKELESKERIEALMKYEIPVLDFPSEVEISKQLTEEERPREEQEISKNRVSEEYIPGPAFHEKSEKNKKTNHKIIKTKTNQILIQFFLLIVSYTLPYYYLYNKSYGKILTLTNFRRLK